MIQDKAKGLDDKNDFEIGERLFSKLFFINKP